MKTVKSSLLIFLCLALCSAAVSRKTDCRQKAEKFLAGVLKGESDKAYDEIFLEAKPQAMQMAKEQTKTGINMYGNLLGYEFIKQQKYGDCIIRLVYILKAEHIPLTWEFYFYKAKEASNWEPVKIKFNDEFDLLADK
jgi:hypothetical protein